MMASERDLRLDNTDHKAFANAMVKCQHPAGACCHLGHCSYGGDCFRTYKSSRREAVKLILGIESESDLVKSMLNDAAKWLADQ